MGREGERKLTNYLGQEVGEEERKKMMSLVSLGMPPISTCKKREVKRSEEEGEAPTAEMMGKGNEW